MALSGYIKTSEDNGANLNLDSTNPRWPSFYYINWSATQSIANNTSTISWSIYGGSNYSSTYSYVEAGKITLKINGETVFSRPDNFNLYKDTLVGSGTTTVKHNADGSLTVPISFSGFIYNYTPNCKYSGTIALDRIPRAATLVSAPNFTDIENPTITYENLAGTAVDKLQACISLDGSSPNIAYRDVSMTSGTYTFNLTTAERNILRNATNNGSPTRTVKFFLATTIDGVLTHSILVRNFTVVDAHPEIWPYVEDINDTTIALTGDSSTLVKYHSTAYATVDVSTYKGASVDTLLIMNDMNLYEADYATVSNVIDPRFIFAVRDTRGYQSQGTETLNMVDYVKLTCSHEIKMKMAGETTANLEIIARGNYFDGTFGAKSNYLSVEYRYGEAGGSLSTWYDMTFDGDPEIEDNTYYLPFMLYGLDYSKAYTVQVRASDRLEQVTTSELTISIKPVFDWGKGDFNFNVPVTIEGNPLADYVIEYGQEAMGTNGTWYWSKWRSGKAECYGVRNYGAMAVSTAWGNLYRSTSFNQDLPSGLFAATPDYIDISFRNANFGAWIARHEDYTPSANDTGGFIVIRPASATLSSSYISFHAIGRWK